MRSQRLRCTIAGGRAVAGGGLLGGAGQGFVRLADRVPEPLDLRRGFTADELLDQQREAVEKNDGEDRDADEEDARVEQERTSDDVRHGDPRLARGGCPG